MRKYFFLYLLSVLFLVSCSSSRKASGGSGAETVNATLDLVNVQDDKVRVTVADACLFLSYCLLPVCEDYSRHLCNC